MFRATSTLHLASLCAWQCLNLFVWKLPLGSSTVALNTSQKAESHRLVLPGQRTAFGKCARHCLSKPGGSARVFGKSGNLRPTAVDVACAEPMASVWLLAARETQGTRISAESAWNRCLHVAGSRGPRDARGPQICRGIERRTPRIGRLCHAGRVENQPG